MAIHTTAEATNIETAFMTILPVKAAAMETKKDFETGKDKLTADKEKQYLTGLKALRVEGNKLTRELKNVSISVLEPLDLEPGVVYTPVGKMTITPYITNNKQQGFSYIVQSLKPVKVGGGE